MEFAGEVEAVGPGVTEFKVGDAVFGGKGSGAHAEFVCIQESAPLAHKPAGMTFEEAASVFDGATLALACLEKGEPLEGRSVLIYGASGSVGTSAVQLAKHFGADVTAVVATKNLELVRSLGADAVIDYTQEDFTKNGKTLRRHLRLRRHALVPAVEALTEAGRDLRRDGPRLHVARSVPAPPDAVDRLPEAEDGNRPLREGRPPASSRS